MNKARWEKAQELAARRYTIVITYDGQIDGKPVHMASCPELPGCVSDGATPREAAINLRDAMKDYIYFLLEDGLDVPAPRDLDGIVRIDVGTWT